MANIGEHLKKGLVSWLMGAAAQAGIQIPDKFDLKGIVQLIASLLGLTWSAIRARIVSRGVPDQAIAAAEAAVPEAQLLAREGLPGLWQQIVARIGDLKAMILGKLSEFLIPTVLIAGITWVVSLLNPASAFVKAVKAIIDIVTFIFERGAQILEFVNSVLDAIIAIAGGGAGGVPALIENALAKSIPVLIGFLAALLGVGGLADKVKNVIQAIARPVMKVVDWVVDKITGAARTLWAKLKGAFGRNQPHGTDGGSVSGEQPSARRDRALDEATRILDDPAITADEVRDRLPSMKDRYGLSELALIEDRRDRDESVYHIEAAASPKKEGRKVQKRVNLPSWRSVNIDMVEVRSGHMVGGSRVRILADGSLNKDLFPANMTEAQVERAIRQAYRYGQKVDSQDDRAKVRGPWDGRVIEMWVNLATKVIETAYPKAL